MIGLESKHSFLETVFHSPPQVLLKDSIVQWSTLETDAKAAKYDVIHLMYFDSNMESILFKKNCGFDIGVMSNRDESTRKSTISHEFALNASTDIRPILTVDLDKELAFRFGGEQTEKLQTKYYFYVKDLYSSHKGKKGDIIQSISISSDIIDPSGKIMKRQVSQVSRSIWAKIWDITVKLSILVSVGVFFAYRCHKRRQSAALYNASLSELSRKNRAVDYTKISEQLITS